MFACSTKKSSPAREDVEKMSLFSFSQAQFAVLLTTFLQAMLVFTPSALPNSRSMNFVILKM